MIIDAILNVIFLIPYGLLVGMDLFHLEFTLPSNILDTITSLCSGVYMVLPVSALMPIFLTRIGLAVFKVVWSIIIRIKSFIPTMGS